MASQIVSSAPLDDVDLVDVVEFNCLSFRLACVHGGHFSPLGVSKVFFLSSTRADTSCCLYFVDPAVVDLTDGHGVEEVQFLAPLTPRDDEACLFEHLQVLHDPKAGHLQLPLSFCRVSGRPACAEGRAETCARYPQRALPTMSSSIMRRLYVAFWSPVKAALARRDQVPALTFGRKEMGTISFFPRGKLRRQSCQRVARNCW